MSEAEAGPRGRGEEPEPVTPPEEEAGEVDRQLQRSVRSTYSVLKQQLRDEKDDIGSTDSTKIYSTINYMDSLYQHVERPREQIADAGAMLELSSNLVSSLRSHLDLGITPSDFTTALLKNFGMPEEPGDKNPALDWARLGHAVSSLFRAAPGCTTMVGPMHLEVKPRSDYIGKGRTARPCEISCPEQLANPTENTQSDTETISAMFNLLSRKKNARLDYLVLNRTSFAQTVENIFALSCLVKEGRVKITVNDEGHHIVYPHNPPVASAIATGEVVCKQFILRLDFKDWKFMKEGVPEGEELMPHRYSQDTPGAAGNRLLERELPMPTQISPIRKDINLTYNRKRLFRNEMSRGSSSLETQEER